MFWTIVGALLFVFVGIPILLGLVAGGVAALTQKITWRIISSLTGGVLAIISLVNNYGQEKDTSWEALGVAFLGFFLFFLGIIGSFSFEKWKEFWKNTTKDT